MKAPARDCIVFRAEDLLPPAWRDFAAAGALRTFNPGLLPDGDGWLFAYRVVGADLQRRIGICRLDPKLRVIEGTQEPLSDRVRFAADNNYPEIATQWFADPRLYRLAGKVFVYWNSGWHEPQNFQFVQELDARTLQPLAPPRELVLAGERRKLEKNWTLFGDAAGKFRAVYSIAPHRILEFSLAGDGEIEFTDLVSTDWSPDAFPANHGGLRGGAPPCLADGNYWSVCHSVHDGASGYDYRAAVYRFSAVFPFAPVAQPATSLELGNPFGEKRAHPKLNPAVGEVIYPCGAIRDGDRWLISHGINDERCAISILSNEEIVATLRPVGLRS